MSKKQPKGYSAGCFFSREDDGFIAFVHGNKDISAWGETKEDALAQLDIIVKIAQAQESTILVSLKPRASKEAANV